MLGVVFFLNGQVLVQFIHHERRPSDPTQIKNGVLLTCALRHFRRKARCTLSMKEAQNFGRELVQVFLVANCLYALYVAVKTSVKRKQSSCAELKTYVKFHWLLKLERNWRSARLNHFVKLLAAHKKKLCGSDKRNK